MQLPETCSEVNSVLFTNTLVNGPLVYDFVYYLLSFFCSFKYIIPNKLIYHESIIALMSVPVIKYLRCVDIY